MFRINRRLLPIKAHYLFFMAAMGPILPQLSVIGKQIGIAPQVMGYITSVLPIMYVLAKPMFGFIADYFSHFRKAIFIALIALMTLSYGGFYFVPMQPHVSYITEHNLVNVTLESTHIEPCGGELLAPGALCAASSLAHCFNDEVSFVAYFTDTLVAGQETLRSNINDTLPNNYVCQSPIDASNTSLSEYLFTGECNFMDPPIDCTYSSSAFWLFVILMCAGTIGFNVVNSISDAICFDMLGESEEDKYGAQRVWGTIGFGASALLAGVVVDLWTVEAVKSFTPALLIMAIFSVCDLLSVAKLKLPKLYASDSIFNDVWDLLCHPSIAIFLVFATIAGIIDSFIIYFMFWHVEEVAAETGYMEQIKLIEGCVVAAECLAGEVPFFFFGGKIIKKLGYVHCMSMCFFFYAVRLALISWIPNPWYLVGVELFFQGCTYALCYTCIVAYASAVAPPGTSATVQGIMAGMDDGLGFSIGSLIGGLAFKNFGGRRSFKYFAVAAIITCIAHIVIRPSSRKKQYLPKSAPGGYQVPAEQEMQVIGVDENKA